MKTPVLILAGGLGTRLRSVLGDIPKPMAQVSGRPFLWWLLKSLESQGIEEVYLSVGFRHESIRESFGDVFGAIRLHYLVESEPLGTGGALLQATRTIAQDMLMVVNGDTLAVLDFAGFFQQALTRRADVTVATTWVSNGSRYGTVEVDVEGRITRFIEKGAASRGQINAGVYLFHRQLFDGLPLPLKFSFEQDFLVRYVSELRFEADPAVTEFIDIGVPEDYLLAQTKIPALVAV